MKKTQETYIYAVVRIAVEGTNFDEPEMVAKDLADAVAKSSKEWMKPVLGDIDVDGAGFFKVREVEFADEVNWTTVLERDAKTGDVIHEHHFDVTGEPMIGRPGFVTAREARLDAEVEALRYQLAARNGVKTTALERKAPSVTNAMNKSVAVADLSEIVDMLLRCPNSVGELDDARKYQSFVTAVAQLICDHCGGQISSLPTRESNWHIGIQGNDSLPEGSEGIWQHQVIPF